MKRCFFEATFPAGELSRDAKLDVLPTWNAETKTYAQGGEFKIVFPELIVADYTITDCPLGKILLYYFDFREPRKPTKNGIVRLGTPETIWTFSETHPTTIEFDNCCPDDELWINVTWEYTSCSYFTKLVSSKKNFYKDMTIENFVI